MNLNRSPGTLGTVICTPNRISTIFSNRTRIPDRGTVGDRAEQKNKKEVDPNEVSVKKGVENIKEVVNKIKVVLIGSNSTSTPTATVTNAVVRKDVGTNVTAAFVLFSRGTVV